MVTVSALPGIYGTVNQSSDEFRHDIHKAPSDNYYLWETDSAGDRRLLFGEWTGSAYLDPVLITGTVSEDTQVWVNDAETLLAYNHREPDGTSSLRTMVRAAATDAWGTPNTIPITDFADALGRVIWGEPSFDASESFMLFVRFDTSVLSTVDPGKGCWAAQLMHSTGTLDTSFAAPIVLSGN